MGSKQSTAVTSSNVNTTAPSNLPAGSASSVNGNRVRTLSVSTTNGARSGLLGNNLHLGAIPSSDSRRRATSLTHVHTMGTSSNGALTIGIPPLVSATGPFDLSGSPDTDGSNSPEDTGSLTLGTAIFGPRVLPIPNSLPSHLSAAFNGIKCPICSKFVIPDDIEYHLVMCLTKPRISYNEDVLREDKGECVICLDDLQQGDTIARLPCLCIYHKSCIDSWFEVNRSCPEHPLD